MAINTSFFIFLAAYIYFYIITFVNTLLKVAIGS